MIDELRRLGLLIADPRGSEATSAGLQEAFGDERWNALDDDAIVERLRSATRQTGAVGERRPRYGALTAGGVLECVIAIGFDETGDADRDAVGAGAAHRAARLSAALRARGYVGDLGFAASLLARRRRNAEDAPWSTYLSRTDGMRLDSPAGGARTVAVVVRIVANTTGEHGEQVASAFVDGLQNASLCVYAGHARYGIGADFEPAVAVACAEGAGLPADPGRLARAAAREARTRSTTIEAVVHEWVLGGRLLIRRSPRSRVRLDAPLRANGPRARLIAALAAQTGGEAPTPAVGPYGTLARAAAAASHRVWFLLSCSSTAWFSAIRSTPGLTPAALRLVGCTERARFADADAFLWVLDAMAGGGTWTDILRALDNPRDGSAQRFIVDGADQDGLVSEPS